MAELNNLEGAVQREGNLWSRKGHPEIKYDDDMQLAISKGRKSDSILKTTLIVVAGLATAYVANRINNPYVGLASGAILALAYQQGIQAVKTCREYATVLETVVLNDSRSKEELKRIAPYYF